MDAHDSVTAKVQAIFKEMAGPRAEALRGDKVAREANDVLARALSDDFDVNQAGDLAFHLVDWNSDAAFIVAVLLFPERFTAEELRVAVDMFLIHAPAHILAAARIGGHNVADLR